MGLRPPMVLKTAPVFWKRLPSPLSSRPERSAVEGPAVRRLLLGNVFSTERSLRNIDQRKVNMFDCLAIPGVDHLRVAARGLDNRRDVVARPCVLVLSRELQVAVLNLAVGKHAVSRGHARRAGAHVGLLIHAA